LVGIVFVFLLSSTLISWCHVLSFPCACFFPEDEINKMNENSCGITSWEHSVFQENSSPEKRRRPGQTFSSPSSPSSGFGTGEGGVEMKENFSKIARKWSFTGDVPS